MRRAHWPGLLAAAPVMAPAGRQPIYRRLPPTDVSVTVYRAPDRGTGSIDLDALGGFALISETRTVHLPAGESRLHLRGRRRRHRTGQRHRHGPAGRSHRKESRRRIAQPVGVGRRHGGKDGVAAANRPEDRQVQRLTGDVLSDADGGVVFKTSEGIEALRCSGLPETFSFSRVTDLRRRRRCPCWCAARER